VGQEKIGPKEKRPRLHAVFIGRTKLEPELPERCRYFFGGVLAGAAGLAAGFTGLGAVLPAGGAATPD
jgi:hypothetical protein